MLVGGSGWGEVRRAADGADLGPHRSVEQCHRHEDRLPPSAGVVVVVEVIAVSG